MGVGKNRKRTTVSPWTNFETLEPRLVLTPATIIPFVSGQVVSFTDVDGSEVKIKLTGPGSGTFTLENGGTDNSSIQSLILNDTTSESKLKITSRGGSVAGTTVDNLQINGAMGADSVLSLLRANRVDLVNGGEFRSNGSIGHVKIRDIGADSQFQVTGNIEKFDTRDIFTAQIDVAAAINKFNARNITAGAHISAGTFGNITVTVLLDSSEILAGEGGLGSAKFGNVNHAVISSATSIGDIVVTENLIGSSLTANMHMSEDRNFGTLDDYVVDQEIQGTIGSIKISGSTDAGDGSVNSIVASGLIGPVTVNGKDPGTTSPTLTLWQKTAEVFSAKYINLDVSQVTPSATGYGDDQIWIAIFGQEIVTPGPGEVPAVGTTYYLSADNIIHNNPNPQSTADLQPGPTTANQVILPSSTLSDWDGRLSLPVPAPNHQYTGRIVISVGAPVQAQVTASDGTVGAPSAGSVTDPSNGTFYDFLEFTVTNFNGVPNLDIDVSQVDSFGIPTELQFFTDEAGTIPFNYTFTGNTTTGSTVISGIINTDNLGEGESISGPGIAPGTTIQSLVPATPSAAGQVTLNKPVTSSQSGATFTAAAAGPVGVQAPRDSIIDGTGSNSFLQFILNQITPTNTAAQPFLESYASQPTTPSAISTGVITNVTQAVNAPITITSINHGLVTGKVVTIDGVLGTTAANGTFEVTVTDSNTFTLNGTNLTTSPAYLGGGTWTQGTITAVSNTGPIVITTTSTEGLTNGDLVRVEGVLGNTAANGLFSIENVTPTSFTLVDSQGNGTYTMGGVWSVYTTPPLRLVSPKDVVEGILDPASSDPLNNYFNNVIDQFFLKYFTGDINGHTGGGQTFNLVSGASGSAVTYSGQTQLIDGYYVLHLNATSGSSSDQAVDYDIYYPFFESNLPSPDIYVPIFTPAAVAPSWITGKSQQNESPSQMVFACDAVFADNVSRGFTGVPSSVLGDLENSISAALNRGIALNDPSTWGNQQTWYQTDDQNLGAYNYWVEYWHQTGLTYGDLAYAFPYDDKFGASTNLNQNNVGLAKITLGSWSNTQATASTTTLTNMPVAANQGGVVTLTATVAGGTTPTGTVTFFIDGVPINSSNASSAPPLQPITLDQTGTATITAHLPALPDGSISHTYTVTAVYSGDANHLPSIAYQSLPLTGANGDFLVSLSPGSGPAGTAVAVTATLPGSNPSGNVSFYFSLSDGSNSQLLVTSPVTSNTVTANVNIPSTILSFTGTTTDGSTNVANVTNVVDLGVGQTLSGTNIVPGTTITGFAPPELILSHPAIQTGVVTLYSNGVYFQGNITQGSTTVTGVMNLAGLSTGVTITGQGIAPDTTVSQMIAGFVTLSQNATGTGDVTIVSNGTGQAYLIKAVYAPTTGDPLTGLSQFSVTAPT